MRVPTFGECINVLDNAQVKTKGRLRAMRTGLLNLCNVKDAPITERQVQTKLVTLKQEWLRLRAIKETIEPIKQSGILDPTVNFKKGQGYVAIVVPSAAPTANVAEEVAEPSIAPNQDFPGPETPQTTEDPPAGESKRPHLREVTGALVARLLRRHVAPNITALVDLTSIKVYDARRVVQESDLKAQFVKGEVPAGSIKLTGNFVVFHYSNGMRKLLVIVLGQTVAAEDDPDDIDGAANLAAVWSDLYHFGVLRCTAPTRKGLDGEWMMVYGLRLSQNHQGDPVSYHKRGGRRIVSEEAVGRYVASRCIDLLVARYFSGALDEMRRILAEKGCPLTATTGYPFTAASITYNYSNEPHVDTGDCAPTIIFWLHHGEVSDGGAFVLPGLGVWFEPQHTTVMWLEATEVYHHTIPPPEGACSAGSGVVGVSLAIHGELAKNLRAWEAKEMAAAAAAYKFVDETAMGKEWRDRPGLQRCLARFPVRVALVVAAPAMEEEEGAAEECDEEINVRKRKKIE